jgi:hypothetical protein
LATLSGSRLEPGETSVRRPSDRFLRTISLVSIPLAVLVGAGLVWHASYAAFSSSTRNGGNTWSTGTVTLTSDDAGAARFTVANMVPGQTDTKCIKVTATATVPGTVKLYLLNLIPSSQGLENYIKLQVTSGNSGSFASCAGYVAGPTLISNQSLAATSAAYNSYTNGVGAWVTAGQPTGESMTYQFTWTFDTSGLTQAQLDTLQGARTGIDFGWELQNS